MKRLLRSHISTHRFVRLLLAAACALPALGACGDDEDDTPVVLGPVELALLQLSGAPDGDGNRWVDASPGGQLTLGCDLGLGVRVALREQKVQPEYSFMPLKACRSKGCVFVRISALGGEAELAAVQAASSEAVLDLSDVELAEITGVRAKLLRSLDGEPVLSKEGTAVSVELPLQLVQPTGCADPGAGAGGAGGASGQGGQAGLGGTGGAEAAGGAGGQAGAPGSQPGGADAGGASGVSDSAGGGGT